MKPAIKLLLKLFTSSMIVILLLEILLQIHNPINLSVKGASFNLNPNSDYVIKNWLPPDYPVLSPTVRHTTNKLGFRGASIEEFKQADLRIITVGGSTTHDVYLGDGETWADVFQSELRNKTMNKVAVINAGLDGHSTFGHIAMFNHFKESFLEIKPTHVIIFCGLNDFGLWENKPRFWDLRNQNFTQYSELLTTIIGLSNLDPTFGERNIKTRILVWEEHEYLDLKTADQKLNYYNKKQKYDIKRSIQQKGGYSDRLQKIVAQVKGIGAIPVFMGQVAIFGSKEPNRHNVDFQLLNMNDWSGKTRWLAVQQYNKAKQEIADKNNTPFIPLNYLLPRYSDYFYDEVHFSPAGALNTGKIVAEEFWKIISQ